jgi:hypothetical protein
MSAADQHQQITSKVPIIQLRNAARANSDRNTGAQRFPLARPFPATSL